MGTPADTSGAPPTSTTKPMEISGETLASSPTPQHLSEHDCIFERLVGDGRDLAGVFGYCYYKRCKRDLFVETIAKHGRPPSDEELAMFDFQARLPHNLALYREGGARFADELLDVYMIETGARELMGLREQAIFEAVMDVKGAVERPRSVLGWLADGCRDVFTSLIGIFILGLCFLGLTNLPSLEKYVENAVHPTGVSAPTSRPSEQITTTQQGAEPAKPDQIR